MPRDPGGRSLLQSLADPSFSEPGHTCVPRTSLHSIMRSSCSAAAGSAPGTSSSAGCDSPGKSLPGCCTFPSLAKACQGARGSAFQAFLVFYPGLPSKAADAFGATPPKFEALSKPCSCGVGHLLESLATCEVPATGCTPATGSTAAHSLWDHINAECSNGKSNICLASQKVAILMACECIACPWSTNVVDRCHICLSLLLPFEQEM